MNISDPLGDMLTRIRNAQMRGMTKVVTPASKLRVRVLDVLALEGYIQRLPAPRSMPRVRFRCTRCAPTSITAPPKLRPPTASSA